MDALSFFPEPSELEYRLGQLRNPSDADISRIERELHIYDIPDAPLADLAPPEDDVMIPEILAADRDIHDRIRRLARLLGEDMPEENEERN